MHHFNNMRFVWMSSCNLTLQGYKEVARQLPRMVVELINGQLENERTEGVASIGHLMGRRKMHHHL
jgi:hypothetical protein